MMTKCPYASEKQIWLSWLYNMYPGEKKDDILREWKVTYNKAKYIHASPIILPVLFLSVRYWEASI